ncbi:hypothetical protein CEXT_631411 [Caerostris extrusa]|uniref:Uncharacterized protein n=1 Tax=Caerostris extrusa TaxID=172846 RepID=A0AAV4YD13_CAEEX|nr:hypothetical protein CEXT_631411 [Caerostris extrusa]
MRWVTSQCPRNWGASQQFGLGEELGGQNLWKKKYPPPPLRKTPINKQLSTPFPTNICPSQEARVGIKNKMPPRFPMAMINSSFQSHDNGKPVGRFQLTTNLV